MPKFCDESGGEWVVKLTYGLAEKVLETTGLDLIEPEAIENTIRELLLGSPRVLRDVLFVLTGPHPLDVSSAKFAENFGPKTMADGMEAIQEAIADFTPRPEIADGRRRMFRAMNEHLKGYGDAVESGIVASLNGQSKLPGSAE